MRSKKSSKVFLQAVCHTVRLRPEKLIITRITAKFRRKKNVLTGSYGKIIGRLGDVPARIETHAQSLNKCACWGEKIQGIPRYFGVFFYAGLGALRNFAGRVLLVTAKTARRKDTIAYFDSTAYLCMVQLYDKVKTTVSSPFVLSWFAVLTRERNAVESSTALLTGYAFLFYFSRPLYHLRPYFLPPPYYGGP